MSRKAGIIDFSVYVPQLYVSLQRLEQWDGVSEGKYTIGLGQSQMAVCTNREDVNSLCLTVVQRLIREAKISYADIGRLDVGTESLIDKSKSVKSVLMQLFQESGNFNVEGADNLNACYGGTAALFNVIDWVESSAWDGRYGLVVMADIAVYGDKAARPTGGAGAIALLIGKDAPISIESEFRASYSSHHYDFYKPNMASNYPMVDGKLSVKCYLTALMQCYEAFKTKYEKNNNEGDSAFDLERFDRIIFHTPYCGLVRKASNLLWAAFDIDRSNDHTIVVDKDIKYSAESLSTFDTDREIQKYLASKFKEQFDNQVAPTLRFAMAIGNSYTSSLYFCLVAALASLKCDESSKRILAFSYGSGLVSSMFSIVVRAENVEKFKNQAKSIIDIHLSHNNRIEISPQEMELVHQNQKNLDESTDWTQMYPVDRIPVDQFFLQKIDDRKRRFYEYKSLDCVEIKSDGSVEKDPKLQEYFSSLK